MSLSGDKWLSKPPNDLYYSLKLKKNHFVHYWNTFMTIQNIFIGFICQVLCGNFIGKMSNTIYCSMNQANIVPSLGLHQNCH